MMTQMMGGHSDERYEAAWEEYANDIPPEEPPTDEEMEAMYRHFHNDNALAAGYRAEVERWTGDLRVIRHDCVRYGTDR